MQARPRERVRRAAMVLAVGAGLCLVAPGRSAAYLNPGTGSYLFQLALALVLGGGFTLRVYWKRIRAWFRRRRGEAEPAADSEAAGGATAEERHADER